MQEQSVNPYEPPQSLVESSAEESTSTYFFSTSTFKLSVMSICTFGLYELYWFYKNWVLIKERTDQKIMPFWRAFFAPLWAYSCFNHIKSSANENDVPESLIIGLLAIVYFILQALWRIPDPYWVILFLSFLLIIPANSVASSVNEKLVSDFTNNRKFSAWNWLAVVLGGSLFLMSLLGTFMPEMLEA